MSNNTHAATAKMAMLTNEPIRCLRESMKEGLPTVVNILLGHSFLEIRLREIVDGILRARAHEVAEAPVANPTTIDGKWRKASAIDVALDDRRVWIEIPTGFTDMQQQAPERALQWRMDVRQLFQAYFSKGYRAVDFLLQREAGFGRYLLAKPAA